MPLIVPDRHAHLGARVTESTVLIAVTVQHVTDDKPTANEVATAIRDGLDSTFFGGEWPRFAWTIERLRGST